jgi:Ca2+-binding EF-hand superfamily protein
MRKLLSTTLAATFMIATVSVVAAQGMKMGMMDMDMMHGCMQGMKMMDANEDGAVSKEEFMQAHEEMFATMDKDGDGKLGAKEQKMMMEDMMGHHGMMEKK